MSSQSTVTEVEGTKCLFPCTLELQDLQDLPPATWPLFQAVVTALQTEAWTQNKTSLKRMKVGGSQFEASLGYEQTLSSLPPAPVPFYLLGLELQAC